MKVEKAFYVVILALVLLALALAGLVVINTIVPDNTYDNNTSINETVKKIDVQLNFQVYVNNKLVVNKWNNGLTKGFICTVVNALAQSEEACTCNSVENSGVQPYEFEDNYSDEEFNDKIIVRLGTDTYHSGVAYDLSNIASSSYVSFEQFPSSSTSVNSENVTITYTWQYTASSSFTFYEVGVFRYYPLVRQASTGNLIHGTIMLVYEDIPDGVSVEPDDVVKIVLKFICERNNDETFTIKFASSFLDKIFKTDYPDTQIVYVWSGIQYRYIEIGKDCFSLDCANNGSICSSNYVELHHETRTYYTNADKTQCSVELKVTYTPSSNVPVKEVCWGFSNTDVGYCKKFDTTLQADVPYVIKVLITFPTG